MTNRERYTRLFLQAAGLDTTEEIVKQYEKEWWWNLRSDTKSGLRLTDAGIHFAKTESGIKVYPVPFPKKFKVSPQTLLWLDQYVCSPYHIDKKNITVMHERAAFELYLFSGDIKKYGRNRALSKQIAQKSTPQT